MKNRTYQPIPKEVISEATQWNIMHGVAFRQADNTAKHCPYSIAPIAINRDVFQQLRKVTPIITKLIHNVAEDHDYLQSALSDVAKADPFFARLLALHKQTHGTMNNRLFPKRKSLLLMRTDFMDDRQHGAKAVEFNGIAAGMAPFGQRTTEFHNFVSKQWPDIYQT